MIEVKKTEAGQLERLNEIEQLTYPPEEAAPAEKFLFRMEHHPFWFRSACIDGTVTGYLCGIPVKRSADEGIEDAMYEAEVYPEGDTFALLSLAVDPAYQRRGIGELLMRTIVFLCREKGMKRIILACKEEKVRYYEKFGFRLMGKSASGHGGAEWIDMELKL